MMEPKNEAELADAIRDAKEPVAIRGGGTRLVTQGAALLTSGLHGITLYEPGALTMVARAGTPLAEVEAALAQQGQMLPFEPFDLAALQDVTGTSTIGGVFATNASGPRRVQAGAARDYLLGVRFVDGRGTIIKNGGRVMKNVTGLDLVKLMAGAHGTLGVLSEVSFKVLPRPETAACLVFEGQDAARAIACMSAALGTPYDVSGAAHVAVPGDGPAATIMRIEGFADAVAYRVQALARALDAFGPCDFVRDPQEVAALWARVRDLTPFCGKPGDVWRLSLRPSVAAKAVAAIAQSGIALEAIYDHGGSRVWIRTPEGALAGEAIRAQVQAFGGHATVIRGATQPRFHPEPSAVAQISTNLRAKFDPRHILNQGLMG